MTILAICKDVAPVIGVTVPSVVYSGTARELVELQSLANRIAKRIMRAHEWELLKTVATYTGDASTTEFALPSDYDRMPVDSDMWSSDLQGPMSHITSSAEWLDFTERTSSSVTDSWTKIGGEISIKPAMATSDTAKHYYISNLIVTPTGAPPNIAAFTADDDVFRLNDELLTLGMIWQWKANKGRPYAEDMTNYEMLQSKLIREDKGSNVLVVGRRRIPSGVSLAYPQTIS